MMHDITLCNHIRVLGFLFFSPVTPKLFVLQLFGCLFLVVVLFLFCVFVLVLFPTT